MNDKILVVISIFISVSLWLYVFSSENRETFIQVPIQIIAVQDGTIASISPRDVSVRVKGPQSFILAANQANTSIDLNVSDYPIARTVVRLSPNDIRIPGLEVLEVTPSRLELNIESTVKEKIRVQPLLFGQPKIGYRVSAIKLTPEFVEAEGIIEYLDGLSSVQTKNIDINGIDRDTSFIAEIIEYNGIKRFEPDAVTVDITVTENIVVHNFYNSKVTCMNGTGSRELEMILPNVTVTAEGRSDIIEELSSTLSFVETDCTKLRMPGIHTLAIAPKTFDKYKVISIFPQNVTVAIGKTE